MKPLPLLFTITILTQGLSSVSGNVIYSGAQDLFLPQGSNVQFFVNPGGTADRFGFEDSRGAFHTWYPTAGGGSFWIIQESPLTTVGVDEGAEIRPDLDWTRMQGQTPLLMYDEEDARFGTGDFFDQEDRYMPLRIVENEEELFGWVRMSHSLADEQLVIHDWAWNSAPGEPILAGEIPEPGTVALLAGIAALAAAGGRRALRKPSVAEA